jgi:hypothetical protein
MQINDSWLNHRLYAACLSTNALANHHKATGNTLQHYELHHYHTMFLPYHIDHEKTPVEHTDGIQPASCKPMVCMINKQ